MGNLMWARAELYPFVCLFPVYKDPVGVCGSLEYRERSVAAGGDVHNCSAELCPGLFLPLPSVWKCSSCSWETFIVSTIKINMINTNCYNEFFFFTYGFWRTSSFFLWNYRSFVELLLSLKKNVPEALWKRLRLSVQVELRIYIWQTSSQNVR